MVLRPALPLALLGGMLLLGGCAYDYATGYAPDYPPGYDSGMGSGLTTQPGDRFGGQNVASIEVFEAPLAPFGQWVDSSYGRAFRPDVPQDWRPYVNGRWGENRLWISDDPWGWATDHYGRWGFDERIGWVWVPGTEWAPSWVAWRDDPQQNVAGWAPVPPGVNYSLSLGFGTGWGYDNFNSWYGPSWVWVPRSYLYQPGFGGRVLPWNYGASYWGGSRWQYQPGWGGRPNWQGNGYRGNGYRPGPGGNGPGYYDRGRNNGVPQGGPRGRPPGQVAVPDRDGFTSYRTVPRAYGGQPGMAGGVVQPQGQRPARGNRPARGPNGAGAGAGDREQYVERGQARPGAERQQGAPGAERPQRQAQAERPQRAAQAERSEPAPRAEGRGRDASDNANVRPD